MVPRGSRGEESCLGRAIDLLKVREAQPCESITGRESITSGEKPKGKVVAELHLEIVNPVLKLVLV